MSLGVVFGTRGPNVPLPAFACCPYVFVCIECRKCDLRPMEMHVEKDVERAEQALFIVAINNKVVES